MKKTNVSYKHSSLPSTPPSITKTQHLIKAIQNCRNPQKLTELLTTHQKLISDATTKQKKWHKTDLKDPEILVIKTVYKSCSLLAAVFESLQRMHTSHIDSTKLFRCWRQVKPLFLAHEKAPLIAVLRSVAATYNLTGTFFAPDPKTVLVCDDCSTLAPEPKFGKSIFTPTHFEAIIYKLRNVHTAALTSPMSYNEQEKENRFVRSLMVLTSKNILNGNALIRSAGDTKSFKDYLAEVLEEIGTPPHFIESMMVKDEFCTFFGKRIFPTCDTSTAYTPDWTNDAGLLDVSFPNISLAAVADGIDSREIPPLNDASGIAVLLLQYELSKQYSHMGPGGKLDPDLPEKREALSQFLQKIADRLHGVIVNNYLGATTLCATLRVRHHCFILNCGDSETRIIHKGTVLKPHLEIPRNQAFDPTRSSAISAFLKSKGYQNESYYPLISFDEIPALSEPKLNYTDTGQGTLGTGTRLPGHVIYYRLEEIDQLFVMSDGIEVFPDKTINLLLQADCLPEAVFVQSTLYEECPISMQPVGKSNDDFTLISLPTYSPETDTPLRMYGSALRYVKSSQLEQARTSFDRLSRHQGVTS